MKTGRVAVFTQYRGPMTFREYPLPDVGPEDMLVKLRLANICGSDLHFWKGKGPKMPSGFPQILGHEMVGNIVAIGKNVDTDSQGETLKQGDRITYTYFSPCRHCWMCLTGKPGCPNRYRHWLGVSSEDAPHFHGGFGEYYYMKAGRSVFKVPEDLPDPLVSPVNCALSQAIYGLYKTGVHLGDTVVIQGCGGLGLYAIAVARETGAGKVIAVDRLPQRLQLAREFGADETISVEETSQEDRVGFVMEKTRGIGADVVAEFAGAPQVVSEGLEMLRWGGRYLWLGNINLGFPTQVDPANVVRCSKVVQGVIVYQGWVIGRALDFLSRTREKYPFHKIISNTFPFSQINEAMAFADQGKGIRVALNFN